MTIHANEAFSQTFDTLKPEVLEWIQKVDGKIAEAISKGNFFATMPAITCHNVSVLVHRHFAKMGYTLSAKSRKSERTIVSWLG